MKKATIFIDVQKDFINKALKNEQAIAVMPKLVEFAKARKDAGDMLYATRDTHAKTVFEDAGTIVKFDEYGRVADTEKINGQPVSGYLATLEGKKLPVEHCIEGEDGWMIDDKLMEVLDGACTFVNKPTFGSFDLAEILAEDGGDFDEITICGFCTDICVASNALILRAKFPNTKITVMKDLCAGVTPETHEAALKTMQMCQIDVA